MIISFSPVASTICTVINWYIMGRETFTIRNNAATMNDVVNDKLCAALFTFFGVI